MPIMKLKGVPIIKRIGVPAEFLASSVSCLPDSKNVYDVEAGRGKSVQQNVRSIRSRNCSTSYPSISESGISSSVAFFPIRSSSSFSTTLREER